MELKNKFAMMALAVSLCAVFGLAQAQTPAPGQGAGQAPAPAAGRGGRGGRGGTPAYPPHAQADPETIARGRLLFSVNCSFCHGSDARGGESGPNLIRSQLVMDDNKGEIIATVVLNGRVDKGMPKFDLTQANVSDIAAYIHSIPASSRDGVRQAPISILVGDAQAGEAFFNGPGKCSTCHSVTGDLAGIGGKYDPKTLQNGLVAGRVGGRGAAQTEAQPTTVKVTLPSGQVVEGKLDRIDDFDVSLVDANGNYRTFRRNGDVPKVETTNPLQAHLNMLSKITDDQIHNLTAYLVTVK